MNKNLTRKTSRNNTGSNQKNALQKEKNRKNFHIK